MAGSTAGHAVGRGNSSEVHACQSDSRYVIRTVRQQDEIEWQRELSRQRRVPALSVITTIYATSGPRALMPRLWPVPRGALRTMEIIRLKFDISAALEMLHRAHIVHADIHVDNVMLRSDPACFVLISTGSSSTCRAKGKRSARCALIIELATLLPSKSSCAPTNGILRTTAMSQTRDKKTRLPILASSGTITRGGNLQIGPPRQVPGAGIGNLGVSGQECGASGRFCVTNGGSANPFLANTCYLSSSQEDDSLESRSQKALRIVSSTSCANAHQSQSPQKVPSE